MLLLFCFGCVHVGEGVFLFYCYCFGVFFVAVFFFGRMSVLLS